MKLFDFISSCEEIFINQEDVVIYGFDDDQECPEILYEGVYWDIPYCFLNLEFSSLFIPQKENYTFSNKFIHLAVEMGSPYFNNYD